MTDLQQKIKNARERLNQQTQQTEALFAQSNQELNQLKATEFKSVEEVIEAINAQSDSFNKTFNQIFNL